MSSNIKVQRICQHCGKEFTARTTTTQYCNHSCNRKAYKARERTGKIETSNQETQRIIKQPIEELNAKAFLSIAEACKLIGISRRTVYRIIERGDLVTGKAGNRTIIRRSDLENYIFEQPQAAKPQPGTDLKPVQLEISECYHLKEVQTKYGISETALQNLIRREGIPKIKKGWFAYVPKTTIDNLLS